MDYCKAKYILLLVLFVLRVTAEENVPVLIWETKSSNNSKVLPPGLAKISAFDFSRILYDKLLTYRNPPLVLVFVEEKLTLEDFGWKNKTGQGSFPQLMALTNRSAGPMFFPSVSGPIIGLKHALFQRGFTIQTLNLTVKSFLNPDSNVNLESVQSTRLAQTTRNPDDSIVESSSSVDLNTKSLSIQSLGKNAEKVQINDEVSKSIPKSDQARMYTEKIANETSAPKAIMFQLSAANPGVPRPSMLRRHDGEIAQAFAARLSAQVDVIGVYTAHAVAVHTKLRGRRQDDEAPPRPPPPTKSKPVPPHLEPGPLSESYGPQVWRDEAGMILLYFHTFPPLYESSKTKVKDVVVAKSITGDKAAKYLKLLVKGTVGQGEVNLALCFSLTASYWELVKIEISVPDGQTVDLMPKSGDVVVARGYSYACRGNVVFTNGKIRLTLTNFQMQAFMTAPKFSKSQDCVTYFSVGIWSGLVVTFVITVVLAWAITMIMNIKVNDKYDDRFGRTIQVGTRN